MTAYRSINLAAKLARFDDHWSPRVVAEMNDYQVKLVKYQGELVWHDHKRTDEVFLVLEGEIRTAVRAELARYQQGGKVVMQSGSWTITARKAA